MIPQEKCLHSIIDRLLENERYAPVVREVAKEFHDGFEAILIEALTSNPGEPIDGAAILAILMKLMNNIEAQPAHTPPSAYQMRGLPSNNANNHG